MWEVLLREADLISALCGVVAAIVLSWPAWTGAGAKRDWEVLSEIEDLHDDDPVSAKAARSMRRRAEVEQLGDSKTARRVNRWGFSFLLLAFLFLVLAGVDRARDHEPSAAHAPTPRVGPEGPRTAPTWPSSDTALH